MIHCYVIDVNETAIIQVLPERFGWMKYGTYPVQKWCF